MNLYLLIIYLIYQHNLLLMVFNLHLILYLMFHWIDHHGLFRHLMIKTVLFLFCRVNLLFILLILQIFQFVLFAVLKLYYRISLIFRPLYRPSELVGLYKHYRFFLILDLLIWVCIGSPFTIRSKIPFKMSSHWPFRHLMSLVPSLQICSLIWSFFYLLPASSYQYLYFVLIILNL